MDTITQSKVLKISFKNFFNLLKEGGKYQIKTPDGWQDIGDIYLKKNKVKKEVNFKSGYSIIVSEDHLFEILTTEYSERD